MTRIQGSVDAEIPTEQEVREVGERLVIMCYQGYGLVGEYSVYSFMQAVHVYRLGKDFNRFVVLWENTHIDVVTQSGQQWSIHTED